MNYSQNNEQQIILDYFKEWKGIPSFLDLGANDGKTLSNTYALMMNGWSGVYVEASPKAFLKLKGTVPERDGLYFYNFALGVTNGQVPFFESDSHITPEDVSLVGSLLKSETDRWVKQRFDEILVTCYRWKTFYNRLVLKHFDFISIDIEGMDYEILSQMDLNGVSMVCVEWNGKDKKAFTDLVGPGFRLIHENGENLIFAR